MKESIPDITSVIDSVLSEFIEICPQLNACHIWASFTSSDGISLPNLRIMNSTMNLPDIPSLGIALGVLYIRATVAAISLFDITNLQAVIYYKNYLDDWWVYRYSVVSLWLFDALHIALSMHALYYYLINLFGNFTAIHNIVWSSELQILFKSTSLKLVPAQVLIILVFQAYILSFHSES
ncbi:hypothetical protein IW261DRAFT_1571949 [Armillaria novae-zelandiae]|uniref:Uncharacterized protein n=1 Tax=Armillaria novae-zelandiae TaxID=153914 RepID=A0AA39NT96_9AGAR|nr:hypothetical protein IW261DRAFT_1571949 [Armillaria novae-zelandiae]